MRKHNGGRQHFSYIYTKAINHGNKTLIFKVKGQVHSEAMSETTYGHPSKNTPLKKTDYVFQL